MKHNNRVVCGIILAISLLHVTALGGEKQTPKFTKRPSARRVSGNTRIEFAMDRGCDVEVAILDAKGKVVRHLAAGVLGAKNPPPDPLKVGLAQSLQWGGKDDSGKPVAGGPFKVRVRAGMGVKFGRLIGSSPYQGDMEVVYGLGGNSLATGTEGKLYIKMASMAGFHFGNPWQVRLFDRQGKYLRTVLPYPPSTPPSKATGFKTVDAGDGLLTPVTMGNWYPIYFRFGHELHHRLVDGCLVFRNADKDDTVNFLRTDGSNKLSKVSISIPYTRIPWRGRDKIVWRVVAFSRDGKYAWWVSDHATGQLSRRLLKKKDGAPQPYGKPLGSNRIADLDCDGKGNLYAADMTGNRIIEIGPGGAIKAQIKVPAPFKVRVSSSGEVLYVVSWNRKAGSNPELLKITGRGAGARITARTRLPWRTPPLGVALDETAGNVRVWLGNVRDVRSVVDKGTQLSISGKSVTNKNKHAIPLFLNAMAVDPEAELLYVTGVTGRNGRSVLCRYNGETGEGGPTKIKTMDVAIGPAGMVYTWGKGGGYQGPVFRYTRDLKPALLSSTGKNVVGECNGRFGRGSNSGGLAVGPKGKVYVYNSIGGDFSPYVAAFDSNGKPIKTSKQVPVRRKTPNDKRYALITNVDPGGGLKVDGKGNVYLGQFVPCGPYNKRHVNPHIPKGFENSARYRSHVSVILKFGPEGGTRARPRGWWKKLPPPAGTFWWWKGVKRTYHDYGFQSGTRGGCICARSRFDVDTYGRLYIPNGITFKVSVRDNNDNEIVKFGGYGNFDAQGPTSKEPKPEIAFGWPTMVGASDKYIYVGDQLNCRVLRADKTWKSAATCPLP
jgi:hypothetical protein